MFLPMKKTRTFTTTKITRPTVMYAQKNQTRISSVSPLSQHPTAMAIKKPLLQKIKSKTPAPICKIPLSSNAIQNIETEPTSRTSKISIVKIKIYSNWGHPSILSCVELDFVDSRGNTLPIKSAMFNKQKATEKMKPLWNHDFNTDVQLWSESWPPEAPHNSHQLLFSVKAKEGITGIRVWPNLKDVTTNIRQVSISIDHVKVFKGEFSQDIGMVIPIEKAVLDEQLVPKQPQLVSFAPSKISFHLKSTYGNTSVVGLHQLFLINNEGNIIPINDKFKLVFDDHKPLKEESMLNRPIPNDTKYELDKFEPWTADITGLDPTITILSKKRHEIGAIIFIGPLLHEGTPDIHVKNISIDFDGKQSWVGRIKHRVLEEEFEFMCATYVFFNEDKEYQNLVRTTVIPERKEKDYIAEL